MILAEDHVLEAQPEEASQVDGVADHCRRIVLFQEERVGLRRILNNPEAPTDALRTALADYQHFLSHHPEQAS